MITLTDWLQTLTPQPIFPGRLRIFCDERCRTVLSLEERAQSEWQGAHGAFLLAAALGAAFAEMARGGVVVVVLPRQALQENSVREVISNAARLGALPLRLLIENGPADSDYAEHQQGKDSHYLSSFFTNAGWKNSGEVLTYEFVHFAAHQISYPPPHLRGDWPPVRMATTVPGSLPAWPVDETSVPLSSLNDWLAWLRGREPQLIIMDMTPPFISFPTRPWCAALLAQLTGEGRRVVWRLPTGVELSGWLEILHDIGRRGLALKLCLSVDNLLSRPALAPLLGWWILVPNDAEEAAAMLAFALEHEDPVVLAVPGQVQPHVPPWPAQQAYFPGSGRWLRHGTRATLVCDFHAIALAEHAAATLAAENISVGVLICSTLMPLPIGEIDQVPGTELFVCGNNLGIAWTSAVLDQQRTVTIIPDHANALAMADIMRKKLTA
jgi:hypothetical protein